MKAVYAVTFEGGRKLVQWLEANWFNALAVLGGVASIIGLFYAILHSRSKGREKRIVYEVSPPLGLATVLPGRVDHKLSIVYERTGAQPINVKGAYLSFITLGNVGTEPVRRTDLVEGDPLRIEVEGARVLDIALAAVTRDVTGFSLDPFQEVSKKTVAGISFEFLDHMDGALIRIMSDSPYTAVAVCGTVIGMPYGIVRADDLRDPPAIAKFIGCGAMLVVTCAVLAGALFVFRLETGGWSGLWLLLLPLGALLASGLLAGLIGSVVWSGRLHWPEKLKVPEWFVARGRYHELDRQAIRLTFYDRERRNPHRGREL